MSRIVRVLALGCVLSGLNIGAVLDAAEEGELFFPRESRERSLLENTRFTVDLSSRVSVDPNSKDVSGAQFVGFDLHKVFTGKKGDWGTAVVQGYVTRIDNQKMHPPFFKDDHDQALVYRIFNFNYTALARGRFNIRVGHYEIPYGLEHLINTNGTLRDYTHGRNLGVKADWGAGVNGQFDKFEYEIGLSRGTGNGFSSDGDPYILAGRLGTPRDENVVAGFSFMVGDVAQPGTPEKTGNRRRFGPDIQVHHGPWSMLAEASYGKDGDAAVINGLAELDWHSPSETWLIYAQTRFFNQRFATGWEDAAAVVVGARFTFAAHWALSAQFIRDLSKFGPPEFGTSGGSLQIRYRF